MFRTNDIQFSFPGWPACRPERCRPPTWRRRRRPPKDWFRAWWSSTWGGWSSWHWRKEPGGLLQGEQEGRKWSAAEPDPWYFEWGVPFLHPNVIPFLSNSHLNTSRTENQNIFSDTGWVHRRVGGCLWTRRSLVGDRGDKTSGWQCCQLKFLSSSTL